MRLFFIINYIKSRGFQLYNSLLLATFSFNLLNFGGLKTLFKQTFVYGLATVLPRLLNIILVPLYTSKAVLESTSDYGQVSIIFSYFIICNVILSYGMETAFFRFYNKEKHPQAVLGTSSISIFITSLLFLVITLLVMI